MIFFLWWQMVGEWSLVFRDKLNDHEKNIDFLAIYFFIERIAALTRYTWKFKKFSIVYRTVYLTIIWKLLHQWYCWSERCWFDFQHIYCGMETIVNGKKKLKSVLSIPCSPIWVKLFEFESLSENNLYSQGVNIKFCQRIFHYSQ